MPLPPAYSLTGWLDYWLTQYAPQRCGSLKTIECYRILARYTLRHTHASTLISRGVPLPAVSARLGHADPHITARIYAHALPPDDARAADEWDRVMEVATAG